MQETGTQQTVEVASSGGAAEHGQPGVMEITPTMMGLTWLTFIVVAVILYKVAWKPILAALDRREHDIRRALQTAEEARTETLKLQEAQKQTIAQADQKAREIIDEARKTAEELAAAVEAKSRQDAQFLLENARRDIESARDKAVAALRKESAELAIRVAGKVIREHLDEKKNHALVDKLMKEL
jgi:F-type H+-transporting ATPase subunit b